MTVHEIIERIVSYANPDAQSCTALYAWIEILENRILREITPIYERAAIPADGQSLVYDLPEGVSFYDIAKVTAGGKELFETTLLEEGDGYYNAGSGKIGFTKPVEGEIELICTARGDTGALVVPDAYADVYVWFALAMYEQANNNIAAYNSYMLAFNSALSEYKASLARRKGKSKAQAVVL